MARPRLTEQQRRIGRMLIGRAVAPALTAIDELRAALGSPDPERVRRALDHAPLSEPRPEWTAGLSDPRYPNRKTS